MKIFTWIRKTTNRSYVRKKLKRNETTKTYVTKMQVINQVQVPVNAEVAAK